MVLTIDLSGISVPDKIIVVAESPDGLIHGANILLGDILAGVEKDINKALQGAAKEIASGHRTKENL